MEKKIKVVITGATGMVGEGVLHVCLEHPAIEAVLVVGRKTCAVQHPKLREVIVPDFFNLENIAEQMQGFAACFFCLGVSSLGLTEEEFSRNAYTLTLGFAEVFARANPQASFCYVSGTGTDSTEKGRIMWARVKGRTENALQKLFPLRAYAMRPGYLHPIKGMHNTHRFYRFISWLYPVLRLVAPNAVNTLRELALAMIHLSIQCPDQKHIEVKDIRRLARGA